MANYPSLNYIPLGMLLGVGDPWLADETLQSGDPGEIAELATAFRDATACTEETFTEFAQARERFQASWNGETGDHPIDDSEEVQRAVNRLFVQKDQLPGIAIDLQNLAADLAEAESQSTSKVSSLNSNLESLDASVGQAIANDRDYSALVDQAEDLTRSALAEVERIRDDYTDKLESAAFDLRLKHGYDPAAVEDVDGDGEISPEQRGRTAPDHYDANQRAKDEALIHSGGPMTPEKAAAEARLRDFAITRDPTASPEGQDLAAERLDDFRMANFVGPLPRDPLTGVDARARAQARLELQRQFEQGYSGAPPLSPDQATQLLNDGEVRGRAALIQDAYKGLTAAGMSSEGAFRVLSEASGSVGNAAAGAEEFADGIPRGEHARHTDYLSASDAEVFGRVAGRITRFSDVIQIAVAVDEFLKGGEHKWEKAGEAAGGLAGGTSAAWLAGIGAASITGPWTTAALVIIAGAAGGLGGTWGGGEIGKQFD